MPSSGAGHRQNWGAETPPKPGLLTPDARLFGKRPVPGCGPSNAATFDLGRDTITIPGSAMTIGLYSAERSIAGAFRLRDQLGYELGLEALREWLRRGGKPARLVELATQIPRAEAPLLTALEHLA